MTGSTGAAARRAAVGVATARVRVARGVAGALEGLAIDALTGRDQGRRHGRQGLHRIDAAAEGDREAAVHEIERVVLAGRHVGHIEQGDGGVTHPHQHPQTVEQRHHLAVAHVKDLRAQTRDVVESAATARTAAAARTGTGTAAACATDHGRAREDRHRQDIEAAQHSAIADHRRDIKPRERLGDGLAGVTVLGGQPLAACTAAPGRAARGGGRCGRAALGLTAGGRRARAGLLGGHGLGAALGTHERVRDALGERGLGDRQRGDHRDDRRGRDSGP
jgi:hypothetical protein